MSEEDIEKHVSKKLIEEDEVDEEEAVNARKKFPDSDKVNQEDENKEKVVKKKAS